MARLAIRATGDRSKRENVTVGNTTVEAQVLIGNKHVGSVVVHDWHDKYVVYYYPQGTGRTLLHTECKGKHTDVQAILACKHCTSALDSM